MVRPKKKKIEKKWKIKDVFYLALALIFSISLLYATFSYISNPPQPLPEPPELYAAIVDPLSVYQPNQTFITEAESLLETSGYIVDVYGWEVVTVDFYQALTIFDYDLIIIRTPTCVLEGWTQPKDYGIPIFLVTTENYSREEYSIMQENEQVVRAQPWTNETAYFALSPDFVLEVMQGEFPGTVIIIAGSYSLFDESLAIELFDKGALAVIGFEGKIETQDMDNAIFQLLNRLLTEQKTLKQGVDEINNQISEESILKFYPVSAGEIQYVY